MAQPAKRRSPEATRNPEGARSPDMALGFKADRGDTRNRDSMSVD
jgi:hypothetical protein